MLNKHTNNFNSGLCPLLSTHTCVDTAVFWYRISDGQLQDRVPLFYLVLLSMLKHISSEPPLHRDARFGDLTVQCDVVSFLDLNIFQFLFEGDGKN